MSKTNLRMEQLYLHEELLVLTGQPHRAVVLWCLMLLSLGHVSQAVQNLFRTVGEGWLRIATGQLKEFLGLQISARTLRRHMQYLVAQGWLQERHNPEQPTDRALQYQVQFAKIEADLRRLGYDFASRHDLALGRQQRGYPESGVRYVERWMWREELYVLTGNVKLATLLFFLTQWDEFVLFRPKECDQTWCQYVDLGWIRVSDARLLARTGLKVSRRTLRKYLHCLVCRGWLEIRANPWDRLDAVPQYRMHWDKLHASVRRLCSTHPEVVSMEYVAYLADVAATQAQLLTTWSVYMQNPLFARMASLGNRVLLLDEVYVATQRAVFKQQLENVQKKGIELPYMLSSEDLDVVFPPAQQKNTATPPKHWDTADPEQRQALVRELIRVTKNEIERLFGLECQQKVAAMLVQEARERGKNIFDMVACTYAFHKHMEPVRNPIGAIRYAILKQPWNVPGRRMDSIGMRLEHEGLYEYACA